MQSSSRPESSRPESSRPDRRWAPVAPVLRIAAEAGFFSVVYATASVVLERRAPLLGPIEFTLLVALGALVGRFARPNPELGAVVLVLAILGGGAACWLASPIARSLVADNFGAAVATHGIGWIGAFAVLRGSVVHGGEGIAFQLEQLLRVLLPTVAVIWALTTILASPALWVSFAVFALWGTLAMIVAGLAGLGLVRLSALHAGVGEGRVRRLWRWLVLAAAVSVIPLSLPFVVLAGIPVGVLFDPFVGPILFVIGLLVIPLGFLVEALIYLFRPFAGELTELLDQLGQQIARRRVTDRVEPSLVTTAIGIAIGALVVAVLLAGAYALARWLLSRSEESEQPGDAVEGTIEHAIVVPAREPGRQRGGPVRRRGGHAAHDAVAAYVSAVDELAGYPAYARHASETPAEHVGRVRSVGMPASPEFGRLAADYQLVRYAELRLTQREDRRALGRLERFRRLVRSH